MSGMRYAMAGAFLALGVLCIGVAYNNNGYPLFATWGQIARQASGTPSPSSHTSSASSASSATTPAMGATPGAAAAYGLFH